MMIARLQQKEDVSTERNPTRLVPVALGATPATPVALVAVETFATRLVLQAGKITGANTAVISIGGNIAYTTDLQIQLVPGDTYVVQAQPGAKFDLASMYISGATEADGVRGNYIPA